MSNSPLRLRGSLLKLQRAAARIYLLLQQRFEGNILVSETWAAMGHDLQSQAESLKKLPASFWQSLKKQEKELAQAAGLIVPGGANELVGSLQLCLAQTLELEEPVILKVYAPLIRRLRVDWTERALDFYVMVKAHIARLERMVRSYSGDPALIQRCTTLFQGFEKEVQEVPIMALRPSKPKLATPAQQKAKALKRHSQASKVPRASMAAKKRPGRTIGRLAKRSKPLAKQIKVARRRAHR